ncbi:WD repeat-containing and planar cell polarity effector protein fritz [Contarinia nasturtii]|uniref:WD repeat-containing and planar cell polarity effector protein fritz n=1 Tax=Contarinia nasturtii TaxID=265458 RepID=UPI0012D3972A|nr:WD repeat-containing and planar cell polarity effector protein fritz [Contarinia nasturtii]
MLTLLCDVKFLSGRDDINIKDTDLGAFKYTEKKSVSMINPYVEGKQDYAHLRDQDYILHGRKIKSLKNSIKKLEEILKTNRIVHCTWIDNAMITMLLSNGILVHVCINIFTGEINRISFDKFFLGKLISESVTNVVMTRLHILISYDINQLTFVYLQKPNMKKNVPEKISRMDPKIFNVIISGTHTKKIARHLACNSSYDLLSVWTKSSQNEVYPWRPTVRDQDRANIHIYKLSRNKLDLLCFHWTENDPISVQFSKVNQNQLRSIEQKMTRKEVTIEICVYEINKSKIQRLSTTCIPLQAQVCCFSFSPDNEKLMLGCIDASVVIFDEWRGITHLIKAAFIPTLVTWHADSACLWISNEKCQIQCFDISLSCIRNQILNEEISSVSVLDLANYFTIQTPLLKINCSKKPDLTQYNERYTQTDSYALLLFENGPIVILRIYGGNGHKGDFHTSGLTADVLIQQYLKLNNVEKAINVLLCLNWDRYGDILMISLQKIANYIFRQPFQLEREAQLTKALGSFLIPVKPLSDETQIEFRDQVRDITRKFFQYLLRNKSYEKAFNLAIDIDDEDIFMDLSNCAKEDSNFELAHDAFCKAETIISRSDSSRQSSHSTCSRDSCSLCDTNSSADDEFETEKSWTESKKKSKSTAAIKNIMSPIGDGFFIPKPELKVSNLSTKPASNLPVNLNNKNAKMPNYSFIRSKGEVSLNDGIAELLKYQRIQKSSKMSQSIPQQPHAVFNTVVDVVPKPQWNIPDQTVGIPTSVEQHGSKPIIHHPLVSGKIPALSHITSTGLSSILSQQQASHIRKEHGERNMEKNKVKFSNTVTVAVVPDMRKEKTMKKDVHRSKALNDSPSLNLQNDASLTWV